MSFGNSFMKSNDSSKRSILSYASRSSHRIFILLPKSENIAKAKKKSCGMVDLGYGNKLDFSRETSFCYLYNALPTEVIA